MCARVTWLSGVEEDMLIIYYSTSLFPYFFSGVVRGWSGKQSLVFAQPLLCCCGCRPSRGRDACFCKRNRKGWRGGDNFRNVKLHKTAEAQWFCFVIFIECQSQSRQAINQIHLVGDGISCMSLMDDGMKHDLWTINDTKRAGQLNATLGNYMARVKMSLDCVYGLHNNLIAGNC